MEGGRRKEGRGGEKGGMEEGGVGVRGYMYVHLSTLCLALPLPHLVPLKVPVVALSSETVPEDVFLLPLSNQKRFARAVHNLQNRDTHICTYYMQPLLLNFHLPLPPLLTCAV